MVMYFDEARDLTETECALVNTTSCNIETVIREREVKVTECGVELEEKCGAVVDTRVEEECKVTTQRMCLPRARDVMSITEESECKLATGAECVQAAAGEPATICETAWWRAGNAHASMPRRLLARIWPSVYYYSATEHSRA